MTLQAKLSSARWVWMLRSKRTRSLQMLPARHAFARPPSGGARAGRCARCPGARCGLNATALEMFTTAMEVVALVGVHPFGPASWPSRQTSNGKQVVDESSKAIGSCRLAPVTQNASGMPASSVTIWRLPTSLPRSVGLEPVCEPRGAGYAGPIDARTAEVKAPCASQLGKQHQVQQAFDTSQDLSKLSLRYKRICRIM
jgi:hypothetical protein